MIYKKDFSLKIEFIELDKRNLLPTSILSLRIREIIKSLKLFVRKLTSLLQ